MSNSFAIFRRNRWWYTLLLLICYSAVFSFWLITPVSTVPASGSAAVVLLSIVLAQAWRSRYFVNIWDCFFHALVIFDIILEAFAISSHEGFGFVLCAVGFGLVVGAYRVFALSRSLRGSAELV